jgi:hypothetical protein
MVILNTALLMPEDYNGFKTSLNFAKQAENIGTLSGRYTSETMTTMIWE